jgi:hypothetical protein
VIFVLEQDAVNMIEKIVAAIKISFREFVFMAAPVYVIVLAVMV